MKLNRIDFEEWADRHIDFEESEVFQYFSEHSFLCPVFCEQEKDNPAMITFEGFKRFAFDYDFINTEVRRTWEDSRQLIYSNQLVWEYEYVDGKPIVNASGSYRGAPNFPKSKDYKVFFRGGGTDSSDWYRTECVNGIKMLPQYYWIKGAFISGKLESLPYL